MDGIQGKDSNDIFMQPCNFCIHCLLSSFRQHVITILCCACAQARSMQETCFVHLLIISSFSCVFPLPLITMATSRKNPRRVLDYCKEGRKEKIKILMFSFSRCSLVTFGCMKAVHLPSQWRASHLLKKKKKKYNLPTSRRKPHLTTYQLLVMQTLCGVQQAAGQLGRINSHLSSASTHSYNTSHFPTVSIFLASECM